MSIARIVFTLVLGVLLGIAAGHAVAEPYNQARADQRETMLRTYLETRRCMHDTSRAVLRMGVTDVNYVAGFASRLCSGAFYRFLTGPAAWSSADALKLLDDMSEREARLALRWGT